MIQDYIDMDTQQKIRYVSESSNASTSGYSTMSSASNVTQIGGGNHSPTSSVYSMPPSPAQSPATAALQTEFSNLNLPSSNSSQHHQQYQHHIQHPQGIIITHHHHYVPLHPQQTAMDYTGNAFLSYNTVAGNTTTRASPHNQQLNQNVNFTQLTSSDHHQPNIKQEYTAFLRIIEHPVEKFRFRYKSEMHGTHGSLNGTNSKRTPKTFPEVELCNYTGRAVIRCSLFQTNLESPHSHQLVVRKDDTDIIDPHDLHVSQEHGYVAQFQNMGIIHTAKKFIYNELFEKKKKRLLFELGQEELSAKQMQELHKETEREAKDMNLNQVRLCFEAFQIDEHDNWLRIATPVYTNPVNNRKSAQTGELRICRLSVATGNVTGGDDLILLVEKVSKKNIKVRFYELNEDEETVWEAFAKFRESDVHHQYAITCQTPPYKNKDIDKPVEVFIELIRPSDDERSFPAVTFRYKPREAIVSRKRRRTNSSATNSSGSGSSISSFELPKTVQEQATNMPSLHQLPGPSHGQMAPVQAVTGFGGAQMHAHAPTISEEFNKDHELQKLIENESFREYINSNSEELARLCPTFSDFFEELPQNSERLEADGASTSPAKGDFKKQILIKAIASTNSYKNQHIIQIYKLYDELRSTAKLSDIERNAAGKKIANIICEQVDKSENGDTLIHELIYNDNREACFKICQIMKYFKLDKVLNNALNSNNESGLHYACLYNKPHYIRPLLGLGCDPDLQDTEGNTALHVAVNEQHIKCIESFLNMKDLCLNLTIKNDKGLTPLHLSIRHDHLEIAEKLLTQNKSAVLVKNAKDGNNALHMAILQQNLSLVQLTFDEQNVNELLSVRNTAGQKAIDLAKELRSNKGKEIYDFLIRLNSDVNSILALNDDELSSSSTDEEEELEIKDEDLKSEPTEVNDADNNYAEISNQIENLTLEQKLQNVVNYQKLVDRLKQTANWKLLARKIERDHFLCIWLSAEDMMKFIKNNTNTIDYDKFVNGLRDVDKEAYEIFESF